MAPVWMGVEPNILGLSKLLVGLAVLYIPLKLLYNIFLHPLRKIPGPLLHRASVLPAAVALSRGKLAHDLCAMHARHGPVVRYAPDQLSFITADAWRDIYGHRTGALQGAPEMPKSELFYGMNPVPDLLTAADVEHHAFLRRQMSHGFSERSLRRQESIIGAYVDLLVRRLRETCGGAAAAAAADGRQSRKRRVAVDLKSWYNWTTLDIIGDLAFGEPFDCLEKSEYHPWVAAINNMIQVVAVFIALRWMGFTPVLKPLLRLGLARAQDEHGAYLRQKVGRRMALSMERPDLIEGLLRAEGEGGLDVPQIQANAGVLIVAGSETTATLLSGATFLLLSNPDKLDRVRREVRDSFDDDSQITLMSVAKLTYTLACLDEALRLYPPVPIGLPRVVPKGGANIDGRFVTEGTIVSVYQLAANTSASNFEEPLVYKPERFLNRDKDAADGDRRNTRDNLDVLQPFSVGPRNCLGKNLAYAEMRLVLAKMLFNFDIELVEPDVNWLNHDAYLIWNKPALNVYLTPVRH